MGDDVNRQILLKRRPEGLVQRDDFESAEGPMPEPADGEVLVRTDWLGIDATVRTWLSKAEGYIPPVEIGEVVRCSGIGTVLRVAQREGSRRRARRHADRLAGVRRRRRRPDAHDRAGRRRPIRWRRSACSAAAGMTAYVGLTEIGKPQAGETVVVSAAAGGTGSIAVQIAKILGCRVIGIAGTDEKCRWLVDELGIDGAINHRTDDLAARLKELCPKRVDVFFDNTGGPILDAVLGRLANNGRVVLCGAISSYNDAHKPPGPANYLNLISRRGRMQGFISWDYWGRWAEITEQLEKWMFEGKLMHREHVFDGLDAAPGRAQRHVHRREHRQDRESTRQLSWAAERVCRSSTGAAQTKSRHTYAKPSRRSCPQRRVVRLAPGETAFGR